MPPRPPIRATSSLTSALHRKSPTDIVITTAVRTPFTLSGGSLKDTPSSTLLTHLLQKIKLPAGTHTDIILGSSSPLRAHPVNQILPNAILSTVHRGAASAFQSISAVAGALTTGDTTVGVAGGVSSPPSLRPPDPVPEEIAPGAPIPRGLAAELTARRYHVSRDDLDAWAVRSHQLASAAQKTGRLETEISGLHTRWRDRFGTSEKVWVGLDDGIKPAITAGVLRDIWTAWKPDGVVTGGNTASPADGAAVLVLATRSAANRLGLRPLARWVGGHALQGRNDEIGVPQVKASLELLKRFGVGKEEVAVWEVDERYAVSAVLARRMLGVREEVVNVNGGSLALGHSDGAGLGRGVVGMIHELGRQGTEKVGVVAGEWGVGGG